jgi:dTDP-4-amino-4,6-dideoxygalactose transaminase
MIGTADPGALYRQRKAEIDEAVARVLGSGAYVLDREVAAFEREFAAFIDIPHAVGLASGTDALECALRVCGIEPGDDVYTVSHTATATIAAIVRCNAVPVLVDIDPVRYTMDPGSLERAVLNRKRAGSGLGRRQAVIPVHLYGCPADMPALLEVARRHDLVVVEDCAQSHGATLQGRPAGAWGDVAAFSFYPTKNLGAMGDAGLVACRDPRLAAKLRTIRQYGWEARYISVRPGLNSRLDELQAAILRVNLGYLERDNDRRRDHALTYQKLLERTSVALPTAPVGARHVYHQYVVQVSGRDDLREALRRQGIAADVHYPMPVHLQPGFAPLIVRGGSLTATEHVSKEILSLPVHAALSTDQVQAVAAAVFNWASGRS